MAGEPRSATATYSWAGALLGFGAPLGFWLVRRAKRGRLPLEPGDRAALAYMALATPVVFGLFGRALGRRENQLRTGAAELARLREEFAAMVAHDLRNPIQAMLLQLDLLLRGGEVEVRVPAATLRGLRRGGERLIEMVRDLLDAARIEAARLALSPQPTSLPGAVAALIEQMRPLLGDRAVLLQVEGEPPLVDADPARLDQILGNLIDNALKYGGDGPIAIRVAAAGAGASCSVEDSGPGIEPADVPRLFDRFYQSQRARANKTGLGLGLYISKGLVDAHGGNLRVESIPGAGATFTVWLPAAESK